MARLIIGEGGGGERRVELGPGVTTVGREAESDIRFGDEQTLVSPRHASLQAETTRWYVRDEGSVYGTFVNDRRVKEQGLADGDVIELGLGGPRMRFATGDEGDEEDSTSGDEGGSTNVRRAFEGPGSDS